MVSVTINDTLNEVDHVPKVHKKVLDILPGVSGGVARVLVGQPFDTVKTRLQVLGKGTLAASKLPPSLVYENSMDCVRKMVSHLACMLARPRTCLHACICLRACMGHYKFCPHAMPWSIPMMPYAVNSSAGVTGIPQSHQMMSWQSCPNFQTNSFSTSLNCSLLAMLVHVALYHGHTPDVLNMHSNFNISHSSLRCARRVLGLCTVVLRHP